MLHRHRRRCLLLALAASVAVLLAPWRPTPGAAAQPPATCLAEARAEPSQPAVLLGEPVELTITLDRLCPESSDPLDVVFVLDGADAPAGTLGPELYQRARETLKIFSPEDHDGLRVSFAARFQTDPVLCALSDADVELQRCIRRLQDGQGGTSLDAGIRDAALLLAQARASPGSTADEAIVIVSSPPSETRCLEARDAAASAREQDILVAAVSIGSDRDEACLRDLASAPAWFFFLTQPSQLVAAFARLRSLLRTGRIASSELRWPLPPDMALVPGSASPPPDDLGPDGRTPTWRDVLAAEHATIALALRSDRAGRHDTGIAPALRWTQMDGREGALVLRPPPAWVLAPRVLPR